MKPLCLILLFVWGFAAAAQKPVSDSLPPTKPIPVRTHSPKVATWLSIAIPGAGQVYNRKNWWWKVPIIYIGGGAMVYGAAFYQKGYQDFHDAYLYRINNKVDVNNNPRFDVYQTTTLQAIRNSYREARDEMYIGLAVLYVMQVVDAAVEAHFFDFNITDDLSLNIEPQYIPVGPMASAGIQLRFNLNPH